MFKKIFIRRRQNLNIFSKRINILLHVVKANSPRGSIDAVARRANFAEITCCS